MQQNKGTYPPYLSSNQYLKYSFFNQSYIQLLIKKHSTNSLILILHQITWDYINLLIKNQITNMNVCFAIAKRIMMMILKRSFKRQWTK